MHSSGYLTEQSVCQVFDHGIRWLVRYKVVLFLVFIIEKYAVNNFIRTLCEVNQDPTKLLLKVVLNLRVLSVLLQWIAIDPID